MTPTTKKRKNPILPIVVVLALAGTAWGGMREGGWWVEESKTEVLGQTVKRGPLRITVVQRGNLTAINSAKMINELEGNVQILSLLAEGTFVEEGDLVVTLDSSGFKDLEVSRDISVQNSQAAVTKAEQALEIQKSQNTSDIAQVEQKLQFAKDDERKYLEGDWPQSLQASEESIVLAEEEVVQAKDRLEWSEKLNEEGFLTRTELETDKLAFSRVQIKYEQAKRAKVLLIDYDNPKQEAVYAAAITEAKRELERVNLQANARLVDLTSTVKTSTARLELETEKLQKLRDQIGKSKLYAPVSGYVVYARQEGGWGRSSNNIEEGATVRERQAIITIPQSGGMMAQASLHESVIKKVKEGMPVTVHVDAIPGTDFQGEVQFVALLPDSNSYWANPNQRLFRTQISVLDATPEMRPGMSCSVEILVKEIPDTLFVPVQAVFRSGGKSICFVEGQPRTVEVGGASQQWVGIVSGLTEGEVVELSAPLGFAPEPDPSQGSNPRDSKKHGSNNS
ncbi:MAG: efflux RND transporter periplasmic adaptor subunit [Planctomycetota bacterium]